MYLGHQIANSQKTDAAKRFVARKQIETIDANKLRADQYKQHYSNICIVLDQLLPLLPRHKKIIVIGR